MRREPGPERLGGRETEAWGGWDLTGGVPTRPRQGRLARCVCRGNPGTPRASSPGPGSAVLPTPKRVLSESPQHTTHHLVSAQKMPVKDTCQRGKQRTEKNQPPVSWGEGSPAEAEPAASPRLAAGPARCLEGPRGGGGARGDGRGRSPVCRPAGLSPGLGNVVTWPLVQLMGCGRSSRMLLACPPSRPSQDGQSPACSHVTAKATTTARKCASPLDPRTT